MIVFDIVATCLGIGAICFLVYALIRPEKF